MSLTFQCPAEHKTETGLIADLQSTIRSVSNELGDRVAELQRQDKTVRDLQTQQVFSLENSVNLVINYKMSGNLGGEVGFWQDREAAIHRSREFNC